MSTDDKLIYHLKRKIIPSSVTKLIRFRLRLCTFLWVTLLTILVKMILTEKKKKLSVSCSVPDMNALLFRSYMSVVKTHVSFNVNWLFCSIVSISTAVTFHRILCLLIPKIWSTGCISYTWTSPENWVTESILPLSSPNNRWFVFTQSGRPFAFELTSVT